MKKILSIALCALLALCLLPAAFAADDYGEYDSYIKEFNLTAVANPDRSYDIVETITVCFNIESQGIYWTLPLEGDAEGYRAENVKIEGAEYVDMSSSYELNYRLGTAGEYITGDKTYVISYTLAHYADYVQDADYLYLNFAGGWDMPIAELNAEVTLPKTGTLREYTITSGSYGSVSGDFLLEHENRDGVITIKASDIPEYEGVTLNAEFDEGAFPDAQIYTPPYVINSVHADISPCETRGYTVIYDISVTPSATADGSLYIRLGDIYGKDSAEVTEYYGSGGEIFAYYSKLSGVVISLTPDADYSPIKARVAYTVSLDSDYYTDRDCFSAVVFPTDVDADVEKLTARINVPEAESIDVYMGRADYADDNDYKLEKTKTGYTFETMRTLKTYEGVQFFVRLPEGTYAYKTTVADIVALVMAAGILILTAVMYFAFGRDRKIIAPVELYPPQGLSPAELGYVINRRADNNDVTSLVFYWASHNHLIIKEEDKGEFSFTRLSEELDDEHTEFEKYMYSKLWSMGSGGIVADDELKNEFYTVVAEVKQQIKDSFTEKRELDDKRSKNICTITGIIIAVATAGICMLCALLQSTVSMSIMPAMIILAASSLMRSAERIYDPSAGKTVRRIIGVLLAVIAALVYFASLSKTGIAPIPVGISAALIAAATMLCSFIDKRTEFGQMITERTAGFANFLRVAKKEQLEELLEKNPSYYYDTLPYAIALGVTRLWADKFKEMTMEPPVWFNSTTSMGESYVINSAINRLSSRVGTDMASTPASSGSDGGGGGFGGGGGGFSGGGFSGGGSGGSGGGRW